MDKQKLYVMLAMVGIHTCLLNSTFGQTDSNRMTSIEAALPVIDKLCKAFADKHHLPGFIYGLMVDGKLVHTTATGYTDVDKKIPVTARSDFRIASMTKSFTAMAILKLRDEGKLELDDPVAAYIPEMKEQPYLTDDASPVTIRQLLTHAAGFPEDNPWGDRQLAISNDAMLGMIRKGISFSNVPGIAYEYSNMGFAMLGYIITKVSGQPYQQYISKQIFIPLKMTHTYWDYEKVPANQLAHGYRWMGGRWVEQPLLGDGAYGAMGGMITSMEDFEKYLALHLSAWPARSGTDDGPVKRSSLREMHHPWNFSNLVPGYRYPGGRLCPLAVGYGYGLGWAKDCDDKITVGHSGGLPGFGSNWRILPHYGIGIISFSNLTYAPAGLINTIVLDTLISLAKLQPAPLPVAPVLQQRSNELVKLLPHWNDAPASGIFAENFFLDYFPDSLRAEATALFNKAGKILKVHDMVPENNLRGSFILEGEKTNIKVSFTLTPENPPLVQEYTISEMIKNN